ncbi:helicase-related protein [Burkholderia pseudomultivorans]|uniref:helicase-related protein n=1 Tax=Burkholderia pseudomultivorans TaxID=1207504 RepID=UPI000AE3AB87|nr:helicase-related protein [Burkholderia pseudomultivorans]
MTTDAAPSVFRDKSWRLSYKTSGLKAVSILHDFYIPALQRAVRYDRVAGYFRSTSLAAASQGFSAFMDKQGKMRLLVGADLEPQDVEAIIRGEQERLAKGLNAALGEPADWTEPEHRGVELLAWMVKVGLLEVRVALRVHAETGQAIPLESQVDGYVHEKWAVLADAVGDRMYISGSLNESKTALLLNAENIDVHCDWRSDEARERTDEAEADFAALWANEHPAFRVLALPDAVKARLISFARNNATIGSVTDQPKEVDGTSAAPVGIEPSVAEWLAFKFIQDAPRMRNGQYLGIETSPIEAWPHQRIVARRLVDGWPLSWMLCDEVGLGKTIETGLALRSLLLSGVVKRVLIAAPASVAPQWQRELADKFLLPFSRALSGGKTRHKILFPQEEEQSMTSLFEPDLNIVSTGLLVREQRQADLKAADNWDVVLLDEAHYARRANPTQWAERPAEWNKLYKVTKDVLRTKARSMWLATATPMQIEQIEAIDLAALTRRLGPFGEETQVALAYYELLGKLRRGENLGDLEWTFLARVAHHVMTYDGAVADFVRRTLLRGRDRRDLEQWLKTIESTPAAPVSPARRAVTRLLFAVAPLSRVMMRHNRGLLQKYREHGKLAGNLAERRVLLPSVELSPEDRAVYELFEPYCQELSEQVRAHSQQRVAVGFMLSFFNLRFASSYRAILDTLRRRREKVQLALDGQLPEQQGWGEDDWEDAVDEQDDGSEDPVTFAGLHTRSLNDLQWEHRELGKLIDHLEPLTEKPSPKVRALLRVMQGRLLPNGRVRQLVLFTRFYDTLRDIQSWIERSAPAVRIGVFSGPRCAYMEGTPLVWRTATREDVKRRFVNGDIDVLLCTDAAAEGLNLQTADLLVNFDLPWNPMKVEQRIGRIDRIGQRYNVIYVANLAYPGTAEEELYVRLQQRIGGAASTVGAQQTILLPVFPNDLRQLAAKEITRDQLEQRVTHRLHQARERAQATELTPDELYAIYASLDEALAREVLPITLEQIYSTLAASMTLKSLGSEVIPSEYGEALLVRGIPGSESFMLTVSRALYERGIADRTESLHFATWGEPAFERVVAFVVGQRADYEGLGRSEEVIPGTSTSVIRWTLGSSGGNEVAIERFEQLPADVVPLPAASGALAREMAESEAREQLDRMGEWARAEAISATAGRTHRCSHLLAAGGLLTGAPANALLSDLNQYLPDATRTLRTSKLEPSVINAEQALGLLEASGAALNVPAFYQPYIVNTLKKERTGLKKARRGTGDEDIPLSDLVQRLTKLAKDVQGSA